ncbi:MAG: seg [candidate division WS6 bacterium 34_10]|uniref:Seg n=1 Tax=candidate division WS6 bacterium 34_10 TaxID=1641389 RepID=A0A101HIE1_9BACT|nr:MAG: seg [candidate division WS6 bacterium 34_10]
MRIKKHNWTSFIISGDNVTVITDPQELKKTGLSFTKTSADVVLFSDPNLMLKENILKSEGISKKVVPDKKKKVVEISSPGEFEIGGLMIRRNIRTNFYLIDELNLRIMYMGLDGKDFNPKAVDDVGDVDVLIAPIGNGDQFLDYDTLEKVFSTVDPKILLPCGFKEEGLSIGKDLKTREDFIKHFGFSNVTDESYITVKPGKKEKDEAPMEVIFL